MANNSFGAHEFVMWLTPPNLPSTQLGINQRPGVPGLGFRDTGVRGEPFAMVSVSVWPSLLAANAAWNQYVYTVATDPDVLVWEGVSSLASGLLYKAIQGGRPIQQTPRKVAHVQGSGVSPANKFILIYQWIFAPVEVTAP